MGSIMNDIVTKAKNAAPKLAALSTEEKNKALTAIGRGIDSARDEIKKANAIDIENAVKNGKDDAFVDRLTLTDKRIDGMVDMMNQVVALDDPVWDVLETTERPNGLLIEKVRVPIGVIGIIFESRPNVTADCTALCLKSGNAVILRGGSDSITSNKAIYETMKQASVKEGLGEGAFILIEDTSRELVDDMLKASWGIDLVMPRGGESLIRNVVEKSLIPVIKHYKGICHVYIDREADKDMAMDIAINAKVQRPGVCNSMETLLIHKEIAPDILPDLSAKLIDSGVKLKGCGKTRDILKGEDILQANDEDYATEYLALILNIKVVDSIEDAIGHIGKYGSDHSDAIVTTNEASADIFLRAVDSSAVYVNASTRFTDGGEFGKGAEIGISTDKLHARGPMGLEELTTYKYMVKGTGQIRK